MPNTQTILNEYVSVSYSADGMQTQTLAGHLPAACQALCQVLARATLPVSGGGVGREWLKTEEGFFSVPDRTVWAGTKLLQSFGSPDSFLISGQGHGG